MNKDELIVKQQLEIEKLKNKVNEHNEARDTALNLLYRPEQWSMKCPDFPKVAMQGICLARDALREI